MDVGLNQIVRKISGVVIEKTSPSPPIFRGKNLKMQGLNQGQNHIGHALPPPDIRPKDGRM